MTAGTRALIADGDRLAREQLKLLLEAEPDILVVNECADGRTLLEHLERRSVDLLFLEIQLPDLNGFQVLRLVSAAQLPAVIFVTADDRHALEAFAFHPIDYVVKPVEKTRLLASINQFRLRQRISALRSDLQSQISQTLAELEGRWPAKDRIAVKSDGAIVFLNAGEIDWVESAGEHLCLHAAGRALLLRDTLYAFEKKVGEHKFVWISRSQLVNAGRIRTVRPSSSGDYSVEMRDGTKLTLGRGYRRAFFEAVVG